MNKSNIRKVFKDIELRLSEKAYKVSGTKVINYGIQFKVTKNKDSGIFRIFNSNKNGIKIDLSQLPGTLKNDVNMIINNQVLNSPSPKKITNSKKIAKEGNEYPIIGIDESGKGDYFGPLVVASVFVDNNSKDRLYSIGIKDSKKLSDDKIAILAKDIMIYPHSVVVISPKRYNELYSKIANLNKLLAWGHARVLENILGQVNCGYALSDKFGDESFITNALMKKGKQIYLKQRIRAEENIAVAAASILARNAFIQYIDRLSKQYSTTIAKGASKKVIAVARSIISQYGEEALKKVAKIHFKTTNKVLS